LRAATPAGSGQGRARNTPIPGDSHT
jgi:hypothetical protein